jgi:integrase
MSAPKYPVHRSLPHGMGTILRDKDHGPQCGKRCDCGYPIRYQWPDQNGRNKPKVETGFASETEALKRLEAVRDLKQEAKDGGSSVQSRGVSAYEYIKDHINSRGRLARRSRTKYLSILKRHLSGPFEGMPMSDLHPWRMRQIIADLRANGVAEDQISVIKSFVRKAAELAIADKILTVDPTLGIEPKPRTQAAKDIPSREEVQRMMSAATPLGRDMLVTMIGTGLRVGELQGLTRDCFNGKRLRIYRQWDGQRYAPLKAREDGQYRDIPVTPQVAEVLTRRFAEDEIAFPMVYKQERFARHIPITRDAMGDELAVLRAAVGDFEGRYSWHSFRHFFASIMIAAKVDITEVGKWLGHANIQITYLTYMHLIAAQFDNMVDVMSTAIDDLLAE